MPERKAGAEGKLTFTTNVWLVGSPCGAMLMILPRTGLGPSASTTNGTVIPTRDRLSALSGTCTDNRRPPPWILRSGTPGPAIEPGSISRLVIAPANGARMVA